MEYYNLKVVTLKQNVYTYKKVKHFKQNKKMLGTIFTFVLCLTILFSLKMINITSVNQVINTATYIVNPINPLYFDMGNIVFTNGYNVVRLEDKNLSFVVPVIYSQTEIKDNKIEFTIGNNPILKASENGVVSDIYYENNIKCIKIKHSKDTYSIIKNVDVLGVHLGAIVKQNQTIGTVKLNSIVTYIVEVGGEYKSLELNKETICVK